MATVIGALAGPDGQIMSLAQSLGLTLQGADERTVYDGFCREWTPAYYLAKRQIFHVHVFKAGIRGIFNFAPALLNLDEEVAYVAIDLALELEQLSFVVSQREREAQRKASS